MFDELDTAAQAGDADQRGARLRRHEGALSAHRLHAAGRPARRQGRSSRRARPTPRARASPGSPSNAHRGRVPDRSRACAWPACCSTQKKYDEALKQLDGAKRRRVRAAGRRPARRHPAGAGQEGRSARPPITKAWTAMDAKVDYRRLVEAKLTALGVAPAAKRPRLRRGAAMTRALPAAACVPARGCGAALRGRRRCSPAARPAEQAQAEAARADRRADHGRAGLEPAASARSSFRSPSPSTATSFTVAGERRQRARARGRHRPRALARQRRRQARRPASAATAASPPSSRATANWSSLEAGQVKWRSRSASRVATAPLVAGERVFVLGVDRTVQAFDASTAASSGHVQRPGDPLTLAQTGVIAAVQGHAARRPGAAPGRPRPDRTATCAGKCRSARRAAPTRSSAWPTWSARPCASATCSARARSRRRSAASTRARQRRLDQATSAAPTRIGGDAELLVRRRRVRPHQRLADAPTATSPGPRETLLYRGLERAGCASASRSSSATSNGTLHWFSRAKGESQAAPADRRQRRSRRRRSASAATLLVVTRSGGLFAFRPPEPPVARARHEARHRPRRPAQRRQVDAVQPHDEDARRDRRRLRRPDARPPLRRRPPSAAASSSSSTPAASSPTAPTGIVKEMAKQTRQAVAEADAVIFVVDVRAGVVGAGPRHRALPAHGRQERRASRPTRPRACSRVAAARRVLRARPGRAASDLGGARAGHPQPARGGARATFAGADEEDERAPRRRARRSGSPSPAGPTSASRR